MEGSGTNYIDTMFQEEDRVGIGVIIRECQGKGLAHMVGIIPFPLTVIELETLATSKALQFDADLSLEDVTPQGVSEIAINALNADSQSLESFGLLSRDVKCFASLFHCIRFSHTTKKLTYCGGPKTAAKSQKPPLKVHLTFSGGCYCGG